MSRPPFRMIDGLRAEAEEAAMEVSVVRAEARQHVAHLRLLAQQLPLWSTETAQRVLRDAAARYERKWADDPELVA